MSEEKEKDGNEEPRDPVEDEEEEVLEEDEGDDGEEEEEEEVLEEDEGDDGEEEAEGDDNLDLEERVLCVDGACIGVVGLDGKCKVCGTPHPDGPPAAPSPAPAASTEEVEQSPAGEAVEREEQAGTDEEEAESGTDDPLDFSKRVLCSDGNCIGVIGKDGMCRTCGKPYTGEPEG